MIDPLRLSPTETRFFGANARYVAIELRFDNEGTATYKAYLATPFAVLFTTNNREVSPEMFAFRHCSSPTLSAPQVRPGRTNAGCVGFKLRKGERPKRFQYSPPGAPWDRGPATWNLRRERHAR